MNTMATQSAAATLLTADEIAKANGYLESTRDELLETVRPLSKAQWHFTPAPDRWSIAEIVEHVGIVEGRVQGRITGMSEAPEAEPGRSNSEVDALVWTSVPERTTRLQAPALIAPVGGVEPAELLERFVKARERTIELLNTAPLLRGRVLPHPVLGLWDGYQWLLAAAGHVARHTAQIREVMATEGFPS